MLEPPPYMMATAFSVAVEALIKKARMQGLDRDSLLIELDDIVSLLREGLL